VVEEGQRRIKEGGIRVEEDAIYQVLRKEGLARQKFSLWRNPYPNIEIPRGKSEITKSYAFLANIGGFRVKILFPGYQQKDKVYIHLFELWLPN
jgi:hypothetical protein